MNLTAKNINVTLVVSDHCPECDELEIELKKIICRSEKLIFTKVDKKKFNKSAALNGFRILITPSLILNGKLVNYGNPGDKKLKNLLTKIL